MRALAGSIGVLVASACTGPSAAPPAVPAPVPAAIQALPAQLAPIAQLELRRAWAPDSVRRWTESPVPAVRRRAALYLGRLRPDRAVDWLLPLLADPDSAVAATAAFAIGQAGDSATIPALASVLKGAGAETVRAEAAYALGKIGGTAAGHAIEGSLRSFRSAEDTFVVRSALLAAARLPGSVSAEAISPWAGASRAGVRWAAAYTLGRGSHPGALAGLLRLAGSDPDAGVRAAATRGLRATLVDSAGASRRPVVEALLRLVADTAYPVRVNALRALGGYADPAAVAVLRTALASSDPHLAMVAAESLGRPGSDAGAALDDLLAAAASPRESAIRTAALAAAARVDPPRGLAAARVLLAAADWRVRAAAAFVVAGQGAGAVPEIAALLADADPRVATAAAQRLAGLSRDSLAPMVPTLIHAAGEQDAVLRSAALTALGLAADPATLPVLLDAYGRAQRDTLNDAALAALDALGALQRNGTPASRALFSRFPRPADPLVRVRARSLFGEAARPWAEPLPADPDSDRSWRGRVPPAALPGRARITTEAGVLELRLFRSDAPATVASFADLARAGYFDGQQWPRVVPNFVVQGGDPRGDTNGGPGYTIPDEINRHRYGTGTLGMALSGPDTGGSQFFLTHSPQPHLDGVYTVFGQLVEGQEVLQRILPGQRILRVEIVP